MGHRRPRRAAWRRSRRCSPRQTSRSTRCRKALGPAVPRISLAGLPPEAHSGDPADHPYEAIWPKVIPLANAAVFAQTRGHILLPEDTAETAKILLNDKSAAVQEARLHMLEIANSARQPWVAYGDGHRGRVDRRRWPAISNGRCCPESSRSAPMREPSSVPSLHRQTRQRDTDHVADLERPAGLAALDIGLGISGTDALFTFVGMGQIAPTVSPFQQSYFGEFDAGMIVRGRCP